MLNVTSDKPAKRLALMLASVAMAFVLSFAMSFGAIAPALAADKPAADGFAAGQLAESGSATVLVYLNGSDLESEAGEATTDVAEMIKSGIGENANVVIETLGTREWQRFGIASDHTQRYAVEQGKLELVDDSLGQLDTTSPDTLSDFISWGVQHYPADRYMLVLWDHGAGPVYGFGYDEFQAEEEALTLDELSCALAANPDVHFDFIGMDCCIMSSIETCMVLQPYCDYTILSEDFEPGIGWSYERWMSMLEADPSISTKELGEVIVDDMVAAAADDPEYGEATLALIDEAAVSALYSAWVDFAYENEALLLSSNNAQEVSQHGHEYSLGQAGRFGHGPGHNDDPYGYWNGLEGGNGSSGYWDDAEGRYDARDSLESWDFGPYGIQDDGEDWYGLTEDWGFGPQGSWDDGMFGYWDDAESWHDSHDSSEGWDFGPFGYWDDDESYVTMSDYFITDLGSVIEGVESEKAAALETAFDAAIVHFSSTSGEEGMSGLSVTLPYGDAEFYDALVDVFTACGIDADYVQWLGTFVESPLPA